ncbi:hypothetical protein M409DRAFT_26295 [Zasmidium cellare ATCC 36951]|uniref:F-box domain-containing protein n=1 Tax=Zasmidium cellare ATCC 36951 TaxID=1080233 RepID=A0A6A6C892_ZASCE|nr:uncharacterized protein M409DRAFT_26295 [Zasmidium cellare ATCC 36951]KAF2163251.1 hypothetical protein M409DRAFT_26295 [Zasmidium cellare ATCC 36951]
MPADIESLSNEVILLILKYLLYDLPTIRILSALSKRFQSLAEDLLYKNVFFRRGDVCEQLLRNVQRHPARAHEIRSLEARCMRDFQNGLQSLHLLLSRTTRLEELTIESPLCNYTGNWRGTHGWDRTLSSLLTTLASAARSDVPPSIRNLPLQRLKRLTLHLSGTRAAHSDQQCRFWIIEKSWAKIFAHPSLEDLFVSYAAFPPTAFREVMSLPRTPLKRLKLVECHVTHEAVFDMLSLPLALEHLHIGEAREEVGCQHEWETDRWYLLPQDCYDDLCRKDVLKVITALKHQAKSLKFLGYSTGVSYSPDELEASLTSLSQNPDASFGSFTRLQEIFCGEDDSLHRLIFDRRFSAPPNLRTYTRFMSPPSPWYPSRSHRFLQAFSPVQALADKGVALKHFNLVVEDSRIHSFEDHQRIINAIAQDFRKKDARMQVWGYFARSWYPPYLYGQMRMQHRLCLDTHWPENNGWLEAGDWEWCDEDFY